MIRTWDNEFIESVVAGQEEANEAIFVWDIEKPRIGQIGDLSETLACGCEQVSMESRRASPDRHPATPRCEGKPKRCGVTGGDDGRWHLHYPVEIQTF